MQHGLRSAEVCAAFHTRGRYEVAQQINQDAGAVSTKANGFELCDFAPEA